MLVRESDSKVGATRRHPTVVVSTAEPRSLCRRRLAGGWGFGSLHLAWLAYGTGRTESHQKAARDMT